MSSLKEYELQEIMSAMACEIFKDEVTQICSGIDCMMTKVRINMDKLGMKDDGTLTEFLNALPTIYRLHKETNLTRK